MVGRDDALQGLEDDLLRRGRDDVEIEAVAVDALRQHGRQEGHVPLEPHAAADFEQVVSGDAAVLGVVAQQVGELRALLHQVEPGERGHFFAEARDPEQVAQDHAGIVEAQRLVEIARQEVLLLHR